MAQEFPVDSQPQHSVCLLRIKRAGNAYGMGIVALWRIGKPVWRPPTASFDTSSYFFVHQFERGRSGTVPEQGALPISKLGTNTIASTAQCDMFFKMINTRSFYSKFRGAVRAASPLDYNATK
jgi:hypothetical protein